MRFVPPDGSTDNFPRKIPVLASIRRAGFFSLVSNEDAAISM